MKTRFALSLFVALIALPLSLLAAEKGAKPAHISKGAPVKLEDYLVPGKTVVFDFYSDYCPPCVRISPKLEALHAKRADIVVVKVDINRAGIKGIDWQSPVAKQFALRSIPHFKIFSPAGKLIAEDGPDSQKGYDQVMKWVE